MAPFALVEANGNLADANSPDVILLAAKLGMSSATNNLKVGIAALPLEGPASTVFTCYAVNIVFAILIGIVEVKSTPDESYCAQVIVAVNIPALLPSAGILNSIFFIK